MSISTLEYSKYQQFEGILYLFVPEVHAFIHMNNILM